MRDHLQFALNGSVVEVRGAEAFSTVADWLRRGRLLTGTKVVCAEGDCGACSVLVGRAEGGRFQYQAIDSCIQFLYQLDGAHVVTVEGLQKADALHPAQAAMVEHFGSQCGYCTPGFVTTLAGLSESPCPPRCEEELRTALAGNLCRCTGYVQILEAARSLAGRACEPLSALYPDAVLLEQLGGGRQGTEPATLRDGSRVVFLPRTLAQACQFKAENPRCTAVAGATDVGVQQNKGRLSPTTILCLAGVEELRGITVAAGAVRCGARATWTELEQALSGIVPEFAAVLRRFGSPQIRNAGTLGGNLANASPIADSIPFLTVMESVLVLRSVHGERRVPIGDFYLGYKKLDLRPEELIAAVEVPLPAPGEELRLFKVSRRQDMDISTFTAAFLARIEAGRFASVRVAFGGVGPTVLRLRGTEEFLQGRPFSEETLAQAAPIAAGEVTPISDVRGSAEYRRQLAENILLKFYHRVAERQEVTA